MFPDKIGKRHTHTHTHTHIHTHTHTHTHIYIHIYTLTVSEFLQLLCSPLYIGRSAVHKQVSELTNIWLQKQLRREENPHHQTRFETLSFTRIGVHDRFWSEDNILWKGQVVLIYTMKSQTGARTYSSTYS